MITRYYGQPLPIVVKFQTNPLAAYGKSYSNIEDISMNLKLNLATDEDDQYLEKKQSTAGVVLDQSKNSFTMNLTTSDYVNLTKDTTYYLTLNVKVAGITDYLELPLKDRTVQITSDTNRE